MKETFEDTKVGTEVEVEVEEPRQYQRLTKTSM
jgi:hypothetical protein